ncbi:hypothetical protein F4778DRAFT_59622 [Xylariomycetidae sp. FL2044]|nr:hypothetical protein F4778DRAFT_59622 [Xylariomycetidae sp. FL2044]
MSFFETDEDRTRELWALVQETCSTIKLRNATENGIDTPFTPINRSREDSMNSMDTMEDDSTLTNSEEDMLIGKHDDPLIPSEAEIRRIWNQGRATWSSFMDTAKQLPHHQWPPTISDLSIMLRDIPSLPSNVPRDKLTGRPVWRISHLDQGTKEVLGADKHFYLSIPEPIQCRLFSRPDSSHCDESRLPRENETPKGLAVLTLCWSYILSTRLLELQGRHVSFTQHYLQPTVGVQPEAGQLVLNLPATASPGLIRWLSAVLSPKLGWTSAAANDFTPWTTLCPGNVQLVCSTNPPIPFLNGHAPTSLEATELLIELCQLCGLGFVQVGSDDACKQLPPFTAGFAAALALPFYQVDDLQPLLPASTVGASACSSTHRTRQSIMQYYYDLRYYMTLSLDPVSVGSMIWSIFWDPQVTCNLVSPWLGAIHSVIQPIIQSRNLWLLAKVFACRRPRVSLMWLGLLLLGDPVLLDRVERYLKLLEERPFHGSLASPDITVAAWTGSPQSFWDESETHAFADADLISRADVLRRRHNFRLRDDRRTLVAWRPFGHVTKDRIEPELREDFEHPYRREYLYWTWLDVRDSSRNQGGFKQDTKRNVDDIPDNLGLSDTDQSEKPYLVRAAPSKKATLSMLDHSVQDVLYDRSLDIADIPNLSTCHEWLRDWRGLE